jgi:hypothetical protein
MVVDGAVDVSATLVVDLRGSSRGASPRARHRDPGSGRFEAMLVGSSA